MKEFKFYVLSRDFISADEDKQFDLSYIATEGEDLEEARAKAWEIVEANISSNNSQDWLLSEKEYTALRSILNRGKI